MNAEPSYTVPPPPLGFHLCYERNEGVWCAFWNGLRVATGATAYKAAYLRAGRACEVRR